jgi:hypothetical protein
MQSDTNDTKSMAGDINAIPVASIAGVGSKLDGRKGTHMRSTRLFAAVAVAALALALSDGQSKR